MSDAYEATLANRVRQLRDKAEYDRAAVHRVLDAGLVAHAGFVQDGAPVVIPMLYARDGERMFLHGARKARIIKLLASGAPACVNVTLIDGIVAARSAFNSSMNYRSVVVFGTPQLIEDWDERMRALKTIAEHIMPGRWGELRAPLDREIKQTGVIELPIESASAKISSGPPGDEEEDYALSVWAGVIPVQTVLAEPVADDRLAEGTPVSESLRRLVGQIR